MAFARLAAAVFAIWLLFAGCGGNGESGGGGGGGVLPEAKGKLTVNGLSSYKGKYIYCSILAGGKSIEGYESVTGSDEASVEYHFVKITGDNAVIPLYLVQETGSLADAFQAYDGNDTVTEGHITIYETGVETVSEYPTFVAGASFQNVTFSGGSLEITPAFSVD